MQGASIWVHVEKEWNGVGGGGLHGDNGIWRLVRHSEDCLLHAEIIAWANREAGKYLTCLDMHEYGDLFEGDCFCLQVLHCAQHTVPSFYVNSTNTYWTTIFVHHGSWEHLSLCPNILCLCSQYMYFVGKQVISCNFNDFVH